MRISATKLFVRDTREMETICPLKYQASSLTQSRGTRRHVRLEDILISRVDRKNQKKGLDRQMSIITSYFEAWNSQDLEKIRAMLDDGKLEPSR